MIRLSVRGKEAWLRVSDNGPGIDTAIQGRIFQPNFTTKSSGMGLGLAMCRNIVAQANGQISFTTEPGVGTTFSVVLPLLEDAEIVID
jgi:signal transduction histidine kinase